MTRLKAENLTCLGCKNEVVRSLNADHSNICKYLGMNDPNYKAVRNALAKAIEVLSRESKSLVRKFDSRY